MSTRRSVAVLMVLSASLLLAGHMAGKAAPAPEGNRKAKKTFEALQKKLPGLVADRLKKEIGEWVTIKSVKAQVKLARLTGPSEAKVTLYVALKVEDEISLEVPQYLSIYLRFYDGQWTTTRIDCGSKMAELAPALMLDIDLAGGE